ncbi:hypothetical protein ACA910_004411 [Epithemia clementina (nom. ined.)]
MDWNNHTSACASPSPRIPLSLQTVFIVSQRGKEVREPPPGGVAFKSFRWFRRSSEISLPSDESNDSPMSNTSGHAIPNSPCPKSPMRMRRRSSNECSSMSLRRSSNGSGAQDGMVRRTSHGSEKMARRSSNCSSGSDVPLPPSKHHISPHAYLTSMLRSRGYATTLYKALETGYFKRPTPLQLASYGAYTERLVQQNDAAALRKVMEAGLSPDACEHDGITLVHLACQLGNKEVLAVLLEFDGSIEAVDEDGRTPLHLACLSREPCFDIVNMILNRNRRLFYLQDRKGRAPLACVSKRSWTEWTRYLMSCKQTYWPDRCMKKEGLQEEDPVALQKPDPCYGIMDSSENEISLHLAVQVAEGEISPLEALIKRVSENVECNVVSDDEDDDDSNSIMDTDEDDDDDEDEEDYDEEDYFSDSTFDENEMAEILGCIGRCRPMAWIPRSDSLRF